MESNTMKYFEFCGYGFETIDYIFPIYENDEFFFDFAVLGFENGFEFFSGFKSYNMRDVLCTYYCHLDYNDIIKV